MGQQNGLIARWTYMQAMSREVLFWLFYFYGLWIVLCISPFVQDKQGMFTNLETHWLCEELIGKYEADF